MFRTIGSKPYTTSATIAVVAPIPPMSGRGIRKPKSARLGIVWNTLARPSTGPRHAGRRVRTTPSGMPMTMAIPVEIATRERCWPTRPQTSWELRA